jgi:hypothetical protein
MAVKYPLSGIQNLISRLSEESLRKTWLFHGREWIMLRRFPSNGIFRPTKSYSLTRDKYGDTTPAFTHDGQPLDFWTAGLINTNYTLKKKEILEGDPLYRIAGFIEIGETNIITS